MIEQKDMDEFYTDFEDGRADGILFIFAIWLIGFNPVLILGTDGPVLSALTDFMQRLGYPGTEIINIIMSVFMLCFFLLGIFLGLRIYKLKRTAWKLLKIYMVVKFVFEISATAFVYFLLIKVNDSGLLTKRDFSFEVLSNEYILRFAVIIPVFVFWFLYMIKSKRCANIFGK